MKAYVSIDLEGLPGINGLSQVGPGYPLYRDAREYMTWMANLAAEALLANGCDEVFVADSHGFMGNIEYGKVREGVTLLQGYPRPFSMVLGVEKADVALFIGYHSAAGTLNGFLDHTYSSRTIYRVELNGLHASEYLLNALYAGEKGVPVILVAGDEALGKQVSEVSPETVFVPLKTGAGRLAAWYPDKARVESVVWKAVSNALEKYSRGELKPLYGGEWSPPYKLDIWVRDSLIADMAQLLPGVERKDAYLLSYKASSAWDALRIVELVAWIGGSASYMMQAMRG